MSIVQISGKLRQGKGILLVYYALKAARRGYKVLANFDISYPNCSRLDYYDFLYLLKAEAPKVPTDIVIDELPTWIDSYTSTQSESNRMASHFCNQSAKLGYRLRWTCQRTKRADINYREMVTDSFRASKFALCNARKCSMSCKNLGRCFFHYELLDPAFVNDDVPLRGRSFNISFRVASRWWGAYNTFERVTPIGLDDFLIKMEKSDPQRLLATVDRQVLRLRENNVRVRTLAQCKVALLRLGESTAFSDLVLASLQLP